jgi:hypothetical protein
MIEVGPRDGLQTKRYQFPSKRRLSSLKRWSRPYNQRGKWKFCFARWVPQMADTAEVLKHPTRRRSVLSGVGAQYKRNGGCHCFGVPGRNFAAASGLSAVATSTAASQSPIDFDQSVKWRAASKYADMSLRSWLSLPGKSTPRQ